MLFFDGWYYGLSYPNSINWLFKYVVRWNYTAYVP